MSKEYEYGDIMKLYLNVENKEKWIAENPESVRALLSYFSENMKLLVKTKGLGI